MICATCQSKPHVYNFNLRCCVVRWLRGAFHEHARTWLDQYQIKHGRSAMLELIAEVKNVS